MSKFLKFAVAIGGLLLMSCNKRSMKSEIKTTSDKLKEFAYVLEGEIQLPVEAFDYQIMYLMDLHRLNLDHPEDLTAAEQLKTARSSPDAFQSAFIKDNVNGWPVLNGDKVDGAKLKFWISRQLRFTSRELEKRGVSLTLSSVDSSSVTRKGPNAIVKYKISTLGVANIRSGQPTLMESPITANETFVVPNNLAQSYFDSMGEGFGPYLQASRQKLRAKSMAQYLGDEQTKQLLVTTKTNSGKSLCYKPDGDHVSPFSYFYYFDPTLPGCAALKSNTSLRVVEVKKLPVQTTYPEFHRLFEDKNVDVFVFLGSVDGEEKGAFNRMDAELKRLGFKDFVGYKQAPMRKKVSITVKGIRVSVEFGTDSDGARSGFKSAIKTHDIVIYDGHAGYGANVDENFTKESSYPDNQYQIFVLNGCSTYKYGMTQLLDSKAINDFDFYHQNVDVITTYTSVSGWDTDIILVQRLLEAIPYFVDHRWDPARTKEFEEKFSWLSIITEYNRVSDRSSKDNGVYMVSGEVNNDYVPGKQAYPGMPEVSSDKLRQLILDTAVAEPSRILAVKSYVKKFLSAPGNSPLAASIDRANQFCLELSRSDGMATVLAPMFYYPACRVKQMWLAGESLDQGLTYSPDKTILFHPTGLVKQAKLARDADLGSLKLRGGEPILFYESGKPHIVRLRESLVLSPGVTAGTYSDVVLYESGRVKKAYVDKPVKRENLELQGEVRLSEDGQPMGGSIANAEVETAGFRLFSGDSIRFHSNGKVHALTSSRGVEIKTGRTFNGMFEFHENGNLSSYVDNSEGKVPFNHNGRDYYSLYLRPDGTPVFFSPVKPFPVSRMPCRSGSIDDFLVLERDGTVVGCKLARDFTIGDRVVSANQIVIWTNDGRVFSEDGAILSYLQSIGFASMYYDDAERIDENW